MGYRPSLDGVRAIAILGVMLDHAWRRAVPGGWMGVDVFFSLSAFLITTLLWEELIATRGIDMGAFYVRRAARLVPALVIFAVVLAPGTAWLIGHADAIPVSSLAALTYTTNLFIQYLPGSIGSPYAHAWSLAVEEQFYLAWPLILLAAYRLGASARAIAAVTAVCCIASSVLVIRGQSNYWLPSGHLPALAAGATAALFVGGVVAPSSTALRFLRPTVGWLALTAMGALFFGDQVLSDQNFNAPEVGIGAFSALLMLVCVTRPDAGVTRLLALGPVVWIGQRSYGLYLYHRILAIAVPILVPGRLLLLGPIVIALSMLLAEASFRWVESPIRQRTRDWLRRRHQRAQSGVDAYELQRASPR